MTITARRSAQIISVALIATVVTQTIYFLLSSAEAEINRTVVWTTESVAFIAIAIFALVVLTRGGAHAAAWAAIALGGVVNLFQTGMGLTMFGPLSDAGEALAPAFQAVLSGAFFLYFAGKFLFGFAAILLGLVIFRQAGGVTKMLGGLALLAGLTALAVNLAAMAVGMDLVLPAGATGTAAALFLALIAPAAATETTEH